MGLGNLQIRSAVLGGLLAVAGCSIDSTARSGDAGDGDAALDAAVDSSTGAMPDVATVDPRVPDTECDAVDSDLDGKVDEAADCDSDNCTMHHFAGHAYLLCDRRLEWRSAESACESVGAEGSYQLVSITSNAENAFLAEKAPKTGPGATALANGGWWMGLRRAVGATWRWKDGTEFASGDGAYENWFPGQPNNQAGNEDCGEFSFSKTMGPLAGEAGYWADIPCALTLNISFNRPYICESTNTVAEQ